LGQRRKIPVNTKEINDQIGEGRKQKKTAEERTRERKNQKRNKRDERDRTGKNKEQART
jgi:hypothetical protein